MAYLGVGLAFCEKDKPIFVERFFQTVGLVLAWGSFGGWQVRSCLVTRRFSFVHVSSKLMCHKDIRQSAYVLHTTAFYKVPVTSGSLATAVRLEL